MSESLSRTPTSETRDAEGRSPEPRRRLSAAAFDAARRVKRHPFLLALLALLLTLPPLLVLAQFQ